jgi:hypothetical protein
VRDLFAMAMANWSRPLSALLLGTILAGMVLTLIDTSLPSGMVLLLGDKWNALGNLVMEGLAPQQLGAQAKSTAQTEEGNWDDIYATKLNSEKYALNLQRGIWPIQSGGTVAGT